MNPGALAANLGLRVASWRHATRFRRALADPRRAQERLLRNYLKRNADTVIGRLHHFDSIGSVEEYRDRVPVRDYDEYAPFIDRIAGGEAGILTIDPVQVLEWSSGSTRAAKLIPFTARLRAEFARAVGTWMSALFAERPALMAGPAYWSVSPAHDPPRIDGVQLPIGPLDDSEYLGGSLARLVEATLAVPSAASRIHDVELHRRVTLLHLLGCRELRLMSVWHPTFLSLLLWQLRAEWNELIAALADGLDLAVRDASVPPRPARARELEKLDPNQTTGIWPHLELISCWTDGPARRSARGLSELSPGIEIQGKGLLATEGVVSIPFEGKKPLAVTSHFLEFLDSKGEAHGAWELEEGAEYSVLLTTGGGLYRYALLDRVTVTGFIGATPSVAFLGKEDHVSDLRGEKLSQGFVQEAIDRTLGAHGVEVDFAMLAPYDESTPPHYRLYLATGTAPPPGLEERLEAELRENPHYAHCVDLGQLSASRVVAVGPDAAERYVRRLAGAGQRLGDIKPVALSPMGGWSGVFEYAEQAQVTRG